MEDYSVSTYGDTVAGIYDGWHGLWEDPADAVEYLAKLADGGRVLELGIGTGRVAIPLAARGLDVQGVDASAEMVRVMRTKPGGDLPVIIGDAADVANLVSGSFSLIYCVFSSFYGILTQKEQLRCLSGVFDRLQPGGSFVVETFYPDLTKFSNNKSLELFHFTPERISIWASRHDKLAQTIHTEDLHVRNGSVQAYPVKVRYVWPAELDLMTRLSGLELVSRQADWNGQEFTSRSFNYITTYRKPG
ncbi:class I SAM-dependent methyltransferase [Tenggerimyces flavus]|uniref:Class I SAM-dependent methyltransferase n=1 Tax=Tenggerimyces flavus TaxID=1708749 RepID=A0ABV7YMN5_9ACTN|nr:class I SAM-dependent methyltransferase [Tenggerimyces flavus]MBM7789584.1 SAM-dependent methyltransferase [Tenggerimyces flavus]